MSNFNEWVNLREAIFVQPPPIPQTWEAVKDFVSKYHGSFVRFDYGGPQIGKLIDLLDTGDVVVQTKTQKIEIPVQQITGIPQQRSNF